ncbi:aa3-type cytochrome oxidase subunit IV [Marisediminicola senii]|uniref:aa3-type cytochrome oxidase subunit IV n=1 Tax=Marisediminicola senii TaxID=2711233 RepID=UPI0013EB6D88|nr:cytochrome c oxidase subunit 4 [Marisediminicola senii]
MKSAARILYVMGGSFLTVTSVYLFWSLQAHNLELVGVITVGLCAVLCLLLAFYFGRLVKSVGGDLLAEDRLDANIDDGDSELGLFSPWSWWPILLAAASTILILGLSVSAWIAIIALPILILCLIGWFFEYYRGYFAR